MTASGGEPEKQEGFSLSGPGGIGLQVWGQKMTYVILLLLAIATGSMIYAMYDLRQNLLRHTDQIEESARANRVQVCLLMLESIEARLKYYDWCVQNDRQYRLPPRSEMK